MVKIDFNLPALDNIAYLMSLKPRAKIDYDELAYNAHQRAFSIAKMTRLDLLADVQASLIQAQAKGLGFEQWQQLIKPLLQKKGWLGKEERVIQEGELRTIKNGSRRLKVIFNTNMNSAYAAAKKRAQFDSDNEAVYLRYVSLMHGNRREAHKKLHGVIKHRDDPFWKSNYPPNGFNCACRVFAYTREQLEQKGWSEYQGELPNVAEISFAKDILAGSDTELEKIYRQKAKRIVAVNAPSKLLKSLVFQDYAAIVENRLRWKSVKELYNNPNAAKKITIAKTSDLLQKLLDTQSKDVFLSSDTMQKQKQKHKELGAFDYYLIAHMSNKPLYKFKDGDRSVVFVEKLGNRYRIVYKVTEDKKEVYVTSFLRYSRDDEKRFLLDIENLKRNKTELDI